MSTWTSATRTHQWLRSSQLLRWLVVLVAVLSCLDDIGNMLAEHPPPLRMCHGLAAYGLCFAAVIVALWRPRPAALVCLCALLVAADTKAVGEGTLAWFVVTTLLVASRCRSWRTLTRFALAGVVVLAGLWSAGAVTRIQFWWTLLVLGLATMGGTGLGLAYGVAHQRTRQAQTLQLAREELSDAQRTAIAHRLHDEVGRSLAYISLQVSVHAPSEDSAELRSTLYRIQDSTQEASQQLAELLGFLREGALSAWTGAASSHPDETERAGAAQLRSCGWTVERHVDAGAFDVPEPVRSILARAISEGYANVVKHARPRGRVSTFLHREGDAVVMRIVSPLDRSGNSATPPTRLGLADLSTRVGAVAGDVETSVHDSTWELTVRLPIDAGLPHKTPLQIPTTF